LGVTNGHDSAIRCVSWHRFPRLNAAQENQPRWQPAVGSLNRRLAVVPSSNRASLTKFREGRQARPKKIVASVARVSEILSSDFPSQVSNVIDHIDVHCRN